MEKQATTQNKIDAIAIIRYFYPADTPLRQMLLHHSEQVRVKAFAILANSGLELDADLVSNGALLHDIGIKFCDAKGILCQGTAPYIAHGVIGGQMLREYALKHGISLEPYARICERHTGSGLTAQEVQLQNLPIPMQDYLPETLEEKLICLADKFFSKSGDMKEKPLDQVRQSLQKFGPASAERFEALCQLFHVQ